MKNQGIITPPKPHNNSTTASKYNDLAEMSDGIFRSLLFKRINDFKDNSNKKINKGWWSGSSGIEPGK
jgi:hypothetical protein